MKSKLDDVNFVNNLDPEGAVEIATTSANQLEYEFNDYEHKKPTDVILAGMGGSALQAILAKAWLFIDLPVPFEVVRGYDLPQYVDDKTLVIVSSYSGNTEETLSCFEQAKERGAQIVVLAKGGKLKELAIEHNLPWYELPDMAQPRFGALVGFLAVVTILERAGLVTGKVNELRDAAKFVEESVKDWKVDVPAEKNQAKQLALELAGKTPVIWGGPLLSAAAYKWKISFNENAKNVAFWNQWPEFNHNEFIGWSSHPVDKPFGIIELVSDQEHSRISQRYEISNRLLSGKMPNPNVIEVRGNTRLEQLLWAVVLGDFISLYLAILNGNNPTPVELVEKLKEELTKE